MECATRHIDETFDINNSLNYTLSIQCSLDGFSFCIFDKTVNKYLVLSNYFVNAASPFQLNAYIHSIFESEPFLNNQFGKVNVCYLTPKLTLLASSLVSSNEYLSITNLMFEPERDTDIVSNPISENTVSLSLIPFLIKQTFLGYFPACDFYTPIMPVLEHDSGLTQSSLRLHATLHTQWLQLTMLCDKELRYANMFYVNKHTDCLYYILNVLKKTGSNNNTPVVLTGLFEKNSVFHNDLLKYHEKVVFGRFVNKHSYSYTFFQEPEHRYLPLIELAQCV